MITFKFRFIGHERFIAKLAQLSKYSLQNNNNNNIIQDKSQTNEVKQLLTTTTATNKHSKVNNLQTESKFSV
jgi:hypothetical protein